MKAERVRPGLAIWVAAFAAVTATYAFHPALDLEVTEIFYRSGPGFFLSGEPWARFVSAVVPVVAWAVGLGLLVTAAWAWLAPDRSRLRRVTVYLIVALLVGPGLLTNVILKDHWGRARPYQVSLFGGSHAFTTPLLPAHQCTTNCSFVAGHPSVGFYLVAFAFLVRERRWRAAAITTAVLAGLGVGFVRLVQGQHFLSDILYSGLLNIGVIWLLYRGLVPTAGEP